MTQRPRIVITGLGTINPLGDTVEEYYRNLLAGKSGVVRFNSIDLSKVECKIGGDLGDYDFTTSLERFRDAFDTAQYKAIKRLFRNFTFSTKSAVVTAIQAWVDAGLAGLEIDPYRTGVMLGGHNLNSNYIFKNAIQFLEEPEYVDPLAGIEAIDPNVPAAITEVLGLNGPAFTLGGACASGNLALRDGVRDILSGETERSIVAGAAYDVAPPDIQASAIINAVVVKPEYQDAPQRASRPFDRDRCGFVYSHGAAALVIEDMDVALKRGAPIYGEILAVRANSNANHTPMPAAEHQGRLMSDVLKAAGVEPDEVGYVNCHATGTPAGDVQEIDAVKAAFGSAAYKLKLNAAKSMLGHTCWASPLVETIGGLMQMRHGRLHPTVNLDNLDPNIDLDVVGLQAQDHEFDVMLKNSFGFGGINCCSLIRKVL